jgi:hypothetical protein
VMVWWCAPVGHGGARFAAPLACCLAVPPPPLTRALHVRVCGAVWCYGGRPPPPQRRSAAAAAAAACLSRGRRYAGRRDVRWKILRVANLWRVRSARRSRPRRRHPRGACGQCGAARPSGLRFFLPPKRKFANLIKCTNCQRWHPSCTKCRPTAGTSTRRRRLPSPPLLRRGLASSAALGLAQVPLAAGTPSPLLSSLLTSSSAPSPLPHPSPPRARVLELMPRRCHVGVRRCAAVCGGVRLCVAVCGGTC